MCCERSLLARDHDSGRLVGDADRRVGLVDVLASRSRSAEGVDAQVGLVDLDLDLVIEHRIHEDGGEGGVPSRLRVERRDPDQSVDALLGLQVPVCVPARDLEGRALDAGFLGGLEIEHLEPESAPFGPPHVHAREHLGPVLRLQPSRSRVDREHGFAMIVLPLEHRAQLESGQALLQGQDLLAPLLLEVGVLLLLQELAQLAEFLALLAQRRPRLHPALETIGLVDDLPGPVRVVPESLPGHLFVEHGEPLAAGGDVKDTPEVRRPAERRPEGVGVHRQS